MPWSKKISCYLTDFMIENKTIPENEANIYQYCFHYLLDTIFSFFIFLLIALLFKEFVPGLLFTAVFFSFRSLAGGFHAPTERLCALLSYGSYIFVLWSIPKITFLDKYLCPIFFIEIIIIDIFSPIDHANKRFDKTQKKKAKKQTFFMSAILSIVFLIFWSTKLILYYRTITICVIMLAASMVLGAIINRRTLTNVNEHSHLR